MKSIKKQLKKLLILKRNQKIISHFGLAGTTLISDGTDEFENCGFDCCGSNNIIILNGNVNLTSSYIFINGKSNRIIIEKGCYINNATFWIEGDNNTIKIGQGTSVNKGNNFTCTESNNLIIGKNCMFSTDVNFQVGDGHPIFNNVGERTNKTEDIIIGDNVWIGKRASILKGVTIPQGCIIGTCAVVTKKFDTENCIIAGVPAKIIKNNSFWRKNI